MADSFVKPWLSCFGCFLNFCNTFISLCYVACITLGVATKVNSDTFCSWVVVYRKSNSKTPDITLIFLFLSLLLLYYVISHPVMCSFQVCSLIPDYPILLMPTHRSYMDFILVSIVFFHYDLPLPVIAAAQGTFSYFCLYFVYVYYI